MFQLIYPKIATVLKYLEFVGYCTPTIYLLQISIHLEYETSLKKVCKRGRLKKRKKVSGKF